MFVFSTRIIVRTAPAAAGNDPEIPIISCYLHIAALTLLLLT
jgi:hypothetical protein